MTRTPDGRGRERRTDTILPSVLSAREHGCPPPRPDTLPPRRGGRPSSKTTSAAGRPAGFARLRGARRSLVGSAGALAAAALLALSVALPATAQTDDLRRPLEEFDFHSENSISEGIWSDGTTMWVVDRVDRQVYAYALAGGTRQDGANGTMDMEFDLHSNNSAAYGIWSDGTTMWVADNGDDKVYAYALAGGTRQDGTNGTMDREFDLHSDNIGPYGIWSDETTMWVADLGDDKVYAYALAGGTRQDGTNGTTNREFDFHSDNSLPYGIWSDGTTMWVVDGSDDKVYAYALAGGTRQDGTNGTTNREFDFHSDNTNSKGAWSNGTTMWVADPGDDKVYAYDVSDLTGTDANAAPTFSSSATFDAAENQTAAGTVVAADSDSDDDVTGYAITGGADQTFFSIGATSGALTFDAAPNFEDAKDQGTNNTYVVTVQATSGTGEREQTATQTITVTVTDVAGEAPGKPDAPDVAAASVTSLTVSWSAPANAGPAIDDYDVQYREGTGGSWSDGGHAGAATTATLSGLSENTSYQVQVRATNDEGTGSWSDSGTGTTDANAAPTFSSSSTFDAAENQTAAGTVLATDSDSEDSIEGYAITGGADQAFFSIGATSGALTFDDAPNFEDAEDQGTNNTYVVRVQATSGTGTREETATQTITVTVTDVAGEAPGKPDAPGVAAASVTSLTVSWSAPANTGPAIDDYDVQYREGTGGSWSDGGHAGAATTATLSGLSENTSYQVQVRATNDEGTGSWSDSGTGTTDANAAPTFSSSSTFDAAENQTEVAMVMASDSDSEDKIERYDITGGADQAFFLVIASSGHLEFRDAPNFEDAEDQGTDNTYVVTVQATSGTGERVKTATQTITVTVTDVAGEAPGKPDAPDVAPASVTSLTVTWSAPANAGPAITDYDVQYRAGTTGDWSDGGHTGTATTATLSGLSENTSYQVQVRASNAEGTGSWSDSGTGRTAAAANAAPSFSSNATFSAAENQNGGGHGAGDRQRQRGQHRGLRNHRRRGPEFLLDRCDVRGADVQRGAQLRGREGPGDQQHLRRDGRGDERHGHAGEDRHADDHGNGDGRGRRSARQAGRTGRGGRIDDEPDGELVGAVQRGSGHHGLRRAVPGGHERELERRGPRRHGGHGDAHGPVGEHVLPGAGAGDQRRGHGLVVGLGQRHDGQRGAAAGPHDLIAGGEELAATGQA